MQTTKVVLEIPDVPNPDSSDERYTHPLREAFDQDALGKVTIVEHGQPNTPEEFSRYITVELTDYDGGMNAIQRILVETEAPPGTMITSYDADGNTQDIFSLAPPDDFP